MKNYFNILSNRNMSGGDFNFFRKTAIVSSLLLKWPFTVTGYILILYFILEMTQYHFFMSDTDKTALSICLYW